MNRLAITAFAGLLATTAIASAHAETSAQPVFSGEPLPESVPSDLPRNARPLRYEIEVTPDAKALAFAGRSSVDIELYETTDTLTLHANALQFSEARLLPAGGNGSGIALKAELDPEAQTVRLVPPPRSRPAGIA